MKSLNKLTVYDLPFIYFIHSPFYPHPPGCAEVVWLTCVWHKRHGTSKPYYVSWHFLDWQPRADWFLEKFKPSRSLLLLWVVLYIEYSFLLSLSLRQGVCSFAGFFHLVNTHLYWYDLLPSWAYRQENVRCHMLQSCCQHPTVMVQGLLLARHLFKGLRESRHSVQVWQKLLILVIIAWYALDCQYT